MTTITAKQILQYSCTTYKQLKNSFFQRVESRGTINKDILASAVSLQSLTGYTNDTYIGFQLNFVALKEL